MAHVEKYNKSAVGRMFAHYARENRTYSNECIDPERTQLNYNLVNHGMSQIDFLHQRLSEVKVQNRKDVNVMCDWIVTAPKDLPTEDLQNFFYFSFEFLSQRYGKENVISANVHMDETTPHMHFAFVPVTEDKKKGGYKVSAKEVLNRKELQSFHKDLQCYLENILGCQVNVLNGATEGKNKEIQELKAKSAEERAEKAEERVKIAEKQLVVVGEKVKQSECKVNDAEYRLKKANAEYDVAVKEMEKVLDKKARASEIHKISHLFGETVSYHKNMLESTRAIGTEAWQDMTEAKKALQMAERLKIETKKKESEIEPLHQKALSELNKARELKENEEKLIAGRAEELAEIKILHALRGNILDRTQRLEAFCRKLQFEDGTTALDKFEELELERERQAIQKSKVPKYNRSFER